MINEFKLYNQKDISLQTPLHIALYDNNSCELIQKLLSFEDLILCQGNFMKLTLRLRRKYRIT